MSRELVVTIRECKDDYVGARWTVSSIRCKGLVGWLSRLFKRQKSVEDHSTRSDAPNIGVAVTWEQYNALADRVGAACDGRTRLLFVPPPPKHDNVAVSI
jgi:hypothetical protein